MPNKSKNFLWRASKEAIPIKKNLVARKVLSKDDHCHSATEDVHHALWDCHELLALWESNALWQFRRTKKFSNFFELVSHDLEEKKNPELFATLVWMIWSRRNTLRTSSKPFPFSQVTPSASQTLQTFAQVLPAPRMQSGALPKQHVRWNPPPPMSLKINFDGAVFHETDEEGLGVVVRDHQGRVMASMSEKIKLPSSSDEVEVLAAMRAISFALKLHLPSVIVEGDSKLIISVLRSEEESFTSFGHLISSIKQSLGIFSCISFSHTHRTGNFLAHNLAQYARHIDTFTVWIEDVPPHLHHVIVTDFG